MPNWYQALASFSRIFKRKQFLRNKTLSVTFHFQIWNKSHRYTFSFRTFTTRPERDWRFHRHSATNLWIQSPNLLIWQIIPRPRWQKMETFELVRCYVCASAASLHSRPGTGTPYGCGPWPVSPSRLDRLLPCCASCQLWLWGRRWECPECVGLSDQLRLPCKRIQKSAVESTTKNWDQGATFLKKWLLCHKSDTGATWYVQWQPVCYWKWKICMCIG